MKIASKISLSFLTVALILSTIVGTTVYFVAKSNLQESIHNNLDSVLASRVAHIETYLKMLKVSSEQLSKSTTLRDLAKISATQNPPKKEIFELAIEILSSAKEANPAIAEFLVMDKDGKVLASSNEKSIGEDMSSDPLFTGGQKGTYLEDVHFSAAYKEPLLGVSAPLRDSRTKEFLGVLAAKVSTASLENITGARAGLGKTGEIYIINKYGYMITSSRFKQGAPLKQKVDREAGCVYCHGAGTDTEKKKILPREIKTAFSEHEMLYVFPGYRGIAVLGAYEYILEMDWGVLAEIDAKEVFAPLTKMALFFFIVFSAVSFIAWGLGTWIGRSITLGLQRLHEGIEIINRGDLNHKVGTDVKDEVGQLSRALDDMTANLKNKTASVAELQLEIERSERLHKVLRESEEKLRVITSSAQDAILMTDSAGKIIFWNDAATRMFGHDVSRASGASMLSLIVPEHARDIYQRDIVESLKTEEAGSRGKILERVAARAGGAEFSVEISMASVTLYKEYCLVWILRDITERKRVEMLLQESEKRFMDVLHASNDAILLIDGETFVDCNEATARMLGYANRAEFLMKHPSELSPQVQPDGKRSFDKANEMMRLAFERGFHRFEWMYQKANGENFLVEVSLTPVAIHGRNILHCLWRDLTESQKTEIKIRQLSQAVEQSPSCVVITDKEGKIEYVNQKFTELTGYSSAEAMGKNPRILKSGEQPSEYYKDLWNTILSGQEWRGQFVNKKKNGELYWEFATIAPIRDGHGNITHFVALKEDITYRRQIEEKLRHSLRMEAVGRLAGGIAHDFSNMLTVINGYSGYLKGKMKPEDPYYDKICQIRDAGDCAATIVRQLLNLSRKEAPKPQLIRVDESIGRMKHMINRLLGDDIEFRESHGAGADFVKMDPGQMEQVLLNLLVNAREAMPSGGVLTLLTDLVRMEEIQEELMPSQKRTGEFVRITVQDTGVGIDPVLRKRIFEPFFTTKKRGMNTGLGLSIVSGIVEQSGGAMSFESQLGRGTTFRVYLPKAHGNDGSQEKFVLEELPQGRGKILLVEDENQVREFALQVLRERGYDVRAVRGGEEALAMLAEDPGRKYDLLLTDLTMPRMNGKDLTARVRKTAPEIKVIFMSGYSEQRIADVVDADFLQKPFSHRALAVKVLEVLGR